MKHEILQAKYIKEDIEHTVDFRLILRLLKYFRPYQGWLFLAIFVLFAAKVIEALVPLYIGHTAQQILDASAASESYRELFLSITLKSCLFLIGLLLLGYILDSISVLIKNWIGQKALLTLRTELYEHIQQMPLNYFDKHAIGRLMTRTIHDVDQINQMFAESLVPLIGNTLLFFCIALGIIFINWKIAIVFFLVLPGTMWLANQFRKNQRKSYNLLRSIVSAMNVFVQEQLMGSSIIRNFGLQQQEKKIFNELNEDHRIANMETVHHFSFFIAATDFMQSLSLILAFFALIAFSPIGSDFQAGTFFSFSLYALMFFRPLADLAERYNVLQSAMAAGERIFEILDQKTELADLNKKGPEITDINSIVFENVWFAYEDENWILKGISFEINKGDSIALVGTTGSGKTTILSLLQRLYEFQKGSIKINGRDLREYSLQTLRRQFSVVLQDPVIFSGSILENITLYNNDISLTEVQKAIDYVNLNQMLNKLPNGLEYQLNERGTSLSVGEMQLISLARAVIHPHSMLILDEATANIDTKTEQLIQQALKKLLQEKTALVIAHRLSTIKDVHKILVLQDGVVAESGSHQELMNLKGLYQALYRIQFLSTP